MRPRYDSLQVGPLLVRSVAVLAVFGVPQSSPWTASLAPFVAGGLLGVVAGFRPERRVARDRVDFVVLRGFGACRLALRRLLRRPTFAPEMRVA